MKVVVPADDAAWGHLPSVCFKTGRPSDGILDTKVRHMPYWVILLMLLSFPLGVLVGLLVTQRSHVMLPSTRGVRRAHAAMRIAPLLVVLLGAAFLLAETEFAFMDGRQAAILGLVAIVAGLVLLLLVPAFTVRGRFAGSKETGRALVLSGVHPAFAAAVYEKYVSTPPQWPALSRPIPA
jgi:hypothetical protein